jgi:asparagine synthase (glutamine-hydrolysing)
MGSELLFDGRLQARGLFREEIVRDVWDSHCAGRANHSHRLWSLLMLELWFREFVDGTAASAVAV